MSWWSSQTQYHHRLGQTGKKYCIDTIESRQYNTTTTTTATTDPATILVSPDNHDMATSESAAVCGCNAKEARRHTFLVINVKFDKVQACVVVI